MNEDGGEDKGNGSNGDRKNFLKTNMPQIYEFLKLYSNDVCFNVFEEIFGSNMMIQSYIDYVDDEKPDHTMLFRLIETRNTSFISQTMDTLNSMSEEDIQLKERLKNMM